MKNFFLVLFIIGFVFAFFYFGYYQDYKRNKREFLRTIIGMPIGFIASMFGFYSISKKIKDWTNVEK